MPTQDSYEVIKTEIDKTKELYQTLRDKTDDYVFSVVAIKANFFKNPSLTFEESKISDIVVDSTNDGGVDFLLTDPNSDTSDLIIGQSKFYTSIDKETISNALLKMILFYKDMLQGNYQNVNENVQSSFSRLYGEVGDESKIHFVFYTSAPKKTIDRTKIENKIKEQFDDSSKIEISILFGKDIVEEINESKSRRANVEKGKITIDAPNNCLKYGDDAAIVNVSAFSIKKLYAEHNTTLLSRNLRYHVAGKEIDNAIKETIQNNPESFWLKNNGITIICDDFDVDGKEVKLENFSVVNGGQTTYILHKSEYINETSDLYFPCKIIRVVGETEDEKNNFSLSIAKATNSQKAIKQIDLKANSPEQIRFADAMKEQKIFYQTKRGETIPPQYKYAYLNTDLVDTGKLCLAGIFQKPCASRNKPSTLYLPKYYELIFNSNQRAISKIVKQLLYIDYYFRSSFIKKYARDNVEQSELVSFANNSRTLCIAFVALCCRIKNGNLDFSRMNNLFANIDHNSNLEDEAFEFFKSYGDSGELIPSSIFENKDTCDEFLSKLFEKIIRKGNSYFGVARGFEPTLIPSNFLKNDKNYYKIIGFYGMDLKDDIDSIFSNYQN